jgi:dihydroneopterin aldolase
MGVVAKSDRIRDAVDYSQVATSLIEWTADRETALIESLGVSMLDYLLDTWPLLDGVALALRKFPLAKADAVELQIEKSRG